MKSYRNSDRIVLPQEVVELLERLEAAGYQAYAVGGCVRDSLLGREPHDWDVTTSAMPEEIMDCFQGERVIPTGLRHGTVTVILSGTSYEITTFRVDGDYTDSRRPDSVFFTRSLEEDLARRDFTVNALAANSDGKITDPYGGVEDLERGIIRCVGEPERRFAEDALRLFRCVRFAAVLDFDIDPVTAEAMCALRQNLDLVARERVREELSKMVMGPGFERVALQYPDLIVQVIPELGPTVGFDQQTPYHHLTVWGHIIRAVQLAEPDLPVRLAMLLHDVGKPDCFFQGEDGIGHFYGHEKVGGRYARTVLQRLRYPGDVVDEVASLVQAHGVLIEPDVRQVRRWLGRLGETTLRRLLMVKRADTLAHAPEHQQERLLRGEAVLRVLEEVIAAQDCVGLQDLAVDGQDLMKLGLPEGREVGRLLHYLVEEVIEDRLPNERDVLLQNAERWIAVRKSE